MVNSVDQPGQAMVAMVAAAAVLLLLLLRVRVRVRVRVLWAQARHAVKGQGLQTDKKAGVNSRLPRR